MILKPNFLLQCGQVDRSLPAGLIVMMPVFQANCGNCGCSMETFYVASAVDADSVDKDDS